MNSIATGALDKNTWMGNVLDIGRLRLTDIVWPGTHNSGMDRKAPITTAYSATGQPARTIPLPGNWPMARERLTFASATPLTGNSRSSTATTTVIHPVAPSMN